MSSAFFFFASLKNKCVPHIGSTRLYLNTCMSIHLTFSSCFCFLFLLFLFLLLKTHVFLMKFPFWFVGLVGCSTLFFCNDVVVYFIQSHVQILTHPHTLSILLSTIWNPTHTHMHLARRDQSNCMCLSCHYVNLKNIQTIIPAQRYFSLLFVPLKFYTGMVY